MNILITSIGTRGYLIDHFKNSLGNDYGIFACDASKYAPGLQKADKAFIVPKADHIDYSSVLLDICKSNKIKVVISINDLELNYLSKIKKEFKLYGIDVIISNQSVIETSFDKYLTYLFCKNNGLNTPLTYKHDEREQLLKDIDNKIIAFPLIAKPRKGSRSVGIQVMKNMKQLILFLDFVENDGVCDNEKHLIQEYIESDKYSIHIFNNLNHKPEIVVCMVNVFRNLGETFHIRTIEDNNLHELGMRIGTILKHLGPLSVDVQKKPNGEYTILEFNPRISGCYSLSHYAGADFPKRIINLCKPDTYQLSDIYNMNLIMLKQFTTSLYTEEKLNSKIINTYEVKK